MDVKVKFFLSVIIMIIFRKILIYFPDSRLNISDQEIFLNKFSHLDSV